MEYEIVKMDENTWRVEDEYVRFFILEGSEKALMIDSSLNLKNAKEIAEGITKKPLMLLNTHPDFDHICGNGAFAEYYIGEEDYVNYKMGEKFPDSKPIFANDGDVIDLGGRKLEVYKVAGHSDGGLAVLDVDKRAIYTGDNISTGIVYMFGKQRNTDKYKATLDKLEAMRDRFDYVIASHDEPILGSDAVALTRVEIDKALAGELPTTEDHLFEEDVVTHHGTFCGFYLMK